MTGSLLDLQSGLPRTIPLFRYNPERPPFSWRDFDPAAVQSAEDLPPYLILGNLDADRFERTADGWSARWQGTEDDTHLHVAYKAANKRWEIRQAWCGAGGGFSIFPARIPLDKVIEQTLYTPFPRSWDSEAKARLESKYQLTVVEQPENTYAMCGIPDGAFRTIVFPIAVRNLSVVRQWLRELAACSPLTYPVAVEARLVFQALNYVEGKAPEWTTQAAGAFNQSLMETGLAPRGFPVREVAKDGSAAWTLRREIYFLFISLPFAGLTDFLERTVTWHGPIRAATDPELRFELRPVVMPAGFEVQTESIAFWDSARTTRSVMTFTRPEAQVVVPTVEDFNERERRAPAALAQAESISGEVVSAVRMVLKTVTYE